MIIAKIVGRPCFGYGFGTVCSTQIKKDAIFNKLLRTNEYYVNIRTKQLLHRFGTSLLVLRTVSAFLCR